MKNKIVIENDDNKETYKLLLKVETHDNKYIIYTKDELNDCGDTICYVATYEFTGEKQIIKAVLDEQTIEFLDSLLIHIQTLANKKESSEFNE